MAEFFPPVIFEIKAKATEAIASFGEAVSYTHLTLPTIYSV